jgi:CheY-like chemotaxis protein
MARILVVEDSPTQAIPIKFVLKKAGFEVDLAVNGVEALKAIEQAPPDVVLTDLQMPEMDGLGLVEAIRQRFPSVPVVLTTAGGNDEIFLAALHAGAAHYASKQGLDFEIVDTVQKVLRVSRGEASAERLASSLAHGEWQWSLDSDPALIPAVVARVTSELTAFALFDQAAVFQIGAALTEALSNAMVRGNLEITARPQENPAAFEQLVNERRQQSPYRERRVHVTATFDPLRIALVVRDEGAGFDASPAPAANGATTVSTDRRGLFLIRTIMDEVAFNPAGTEVTMIKRRAGK